MKDFKALFLILTILIGFNLALPPVSLGAENNTVEVIAGFENEAGKQAIINSSQTVKQSFEHVQAVHAVMEKDDLAEVRSHSGVAYVEENIEIKLSKSNPEFNENIDESSLREEEKWNLQSVNAPSAWKEGYTGKGVKIAIIDSGIASHSDLNVAGGVSMLESTEDWTDDNGHGTLVAGIIGSLYNQSGTAGVAPDAELFAVKALDQNGKGTVSSFVGAVEWSIEQDMDIINFSLGTETMDEAMKNVLQQAYESGILIVGASGNNGPEGSIDYPAKYDSVIAVSSMDRILEISDYSSIGKEVEFSAPGTDIISTYLNDTYASSTGTSIAVPHVTGMLALLKQRYPKMTNTELREELTKHTEDLGPAGRDAGYGHGLVRYSVSDILPPAEITSPAHIEESGGSATVTWNAPLDEDYEAVNIYMEGNMVASVHADEAQSHTFAELQAGNTYKYVFKTADKLGNESAGIEYVINVKERKVKQADTTDQPVSEPAPKASTTETANDQLKNEKTGSTKNPSETPETKANEKLISEEKTEPQSKADSSADESAKQKTADDVDQEPSSFQIEATPVTPVAPKQKEKEYIESTEPQKQQHKKVQPDEELIITASDESDSEQADEETAEPQAKEDETEDNPENKEEEQKENFFQRLINGVMGFIHSLISGIGSLFISIFPGTN